MATADNTAAAPTTTTPPFPKLPLFGTTPLSSPAAGGHLACNPAIGLTATAGDGSASLHVWRAGEHGLVSSYAGRGGARVEGVRWRADGTFFFLRFFRFLPSPPSLPWLSEIFGGM